MKKELMVAVPILLLFIVGCSVEQPKIEEKVTSGTCVPKFEIVNSFELTASEVYAEECFSKENKEECLTVDVYRASEKDFVSGDGIPDCEWILE